MKRGGHSQKIVELVQRNNVLDFLDTLLLEFSHFFYYTVYELITKMKKIKNAHLRYLDTALFKIVICC